MTDRVVGVLKSVAAGVLGIAGGLGLVALIFPFDEVWRGAAVGGLTAWGTSFVLLLPYVVGGEGGEE